MQYDNIRSGMDAVDRDGDKIGTIEDVGSRSLLVTKGLIFPKDIYVPFSAIESVSEDGYVRLNVDKDEIESLGWYDVPAETEVTASDDAGYAGSDTAYTQEATAYDQTPTTMTDRDSMRVPVHEEQLRAEKVRGQAGEVEVRRDVVEEQQTLDVPVTREEVDVHRYAVDRPASEAETVDTFRVPVMGERVNVEKDVRVAEEVEISKRPVTETQRVSDTVRREEVEV